MCPQLGAGGVVIMTFMALKVYFHEVVIAAAIGRSGMQAAWPPLERQQCIDECRFLGKVEEVGLVLPLAHTTPR